MKCKKGNLMSRKIENELKKELLEQKRKKLEKSFKDYCLSHGKAPLTRRDFLGAGLISFTASMTLPGLAGMLIPRQAYAQASDCPSSVAGVNLASFVTLNLAGGGMLAANYVPTDSGGQFLASYNKMGMGNGSLNIEREFGNVPFAGDDGTGVLISKLLTQLRANTSQATRDKTAFVAIPVRSRDDSGMNLFDATGMVSKAGLIGSELPNLGKRASDTGINQMYAKVKPPTPLTVGSYTDIDGALNLGATGPLATMDDAQKISLLKLVSNLNESQVNNVNANAGGRMLASLVNCSSSKNIELAEREKPSVDIRQDATLAGIWGVNTGSNNNTQGVIFGSMVKAGLMGTAGTVSLEIGGYDYHNGSRTTGDQKDGEAGAAIGRILETAATLGKKVFIYVTSDGATVSPVSEARNAPWQSDRGEAGMAYVIAFDPAGRPSTSGHQIGQFTSGQAVDDKFITGGNPELAASAVFANYLKFNKRMDLLAPIIGSTFNSSQLDQVIKFA
jgi:hypothetical protein